MTSAAPIRLSGLTKRFARLTAVDGIDLTVERGEVVALLGPNGAGKSTTIDLALGLSSPTAGTAELFGGTPREAVVAGRVGAMLQGGALLPTTTVAESVALVAAAHRHPLPVSDAMARAGVTAFAKQKVSRLSGGQLQRARFAVAIVSDPQLLILDEPTAAMDVEGRRAFWTSMHDLTDTGRTVVFATHYLDEADAFADRVVMLSRGRIVADGTPAEVKAVVAGRSLAFSLRDPAATLADLLRGRPDVQLVDVRGEHLRVATTDSDAVLRLVLDRASRRARHRGHRSHDGRRLPRPDRHDGRGGLPMNPRYVLLDAVRQLRNVRSVVFTFVVPIAMLLIFGSAYGSGGAIDQATRLPWLVETTIQMGGYGAMMAGLSQAFAIVTERSIGWNRQLRLTPLTGTTYLLSKVVAALLVAAVSIALVVLVAVVVLHADLGPGAWLAAGFGLWIGIVPFALIAILIGQYARPDFAQPLFMVTFLGLSILGGLWVPLSIMPSWMGTVARVVPSYWLNRLGQLGATGSGDVAVPVLVLGAWTVALAALITWRYRHDAARA